MWVRSTTSLTDNTFQLTSATASHLLIQGGSLLLVNAGLAAEASRLIEKIEQSTTDELVADILLLNSAHPAHVGALPILRKRFPELSVLASPTLKQLFTDEKYIQSVIRFNQHCAEALGVADVYANLDSINECFTIEQIVRDGDALDLGDGFEVKIIACPSYSEDALAYLVQPDGVLAIGNALGGYFGRDRLTPCFKTGLESFIGMLDKLASLDLSALSFAHCGTITGNLMQTFLTQMREEANRLDGHIRQKIADGEVVSEVVDSIALEWTSQGLAPDGPFTEATRQALQVMIEQVIKTKPPES